MTVSTLYNLIILLIVMVSFDYNFATVPSRIMKWYSTDVSGVYYNSDNENMVIKRNEKFITS